ncbi:MAG: hypothetical protein U5N55_00020 [Cypionkella sp.]|nr:hypothetical protein [Cypionkella sp.]
MFEFKMQDSLVALDLGVLRVLRFDSFWFLWSENSYFGASAKLNYLEFSEWAALRDKLADALKETMDWEMQKQRLESRV